MQQVMRILAACAPAVEVGKVPQGILRVIPIIGGRFEGEKLRGTVLNVGAEHLASKRKRTCLCKIFAENGRRRCHSN